MTHDTNKVNMNWKDGLIDGCLITPLRKFSDARGWLGEFYRHDELDPALHPVMGYISMTHPGVARGPHEHLDQTDLFVFFKGAFRLYLWDNRHASPTFGHRQVVDLGEANPTVAIVPSNYSVTGIYFYDKQVFEIIRNLEPSRRGEYEVSDVSTAYVRLEQLTYGVLDGWWGDAGTLEGWHEANELARDLVYEELENGK